MPCIAEWVLRGPLEMKAKKGPRVVFVCVFCFLLPGEAQLRYSREGGEITHKV